MNSEKVEVPLEMAKGHPWLVSRHRALMRLALTVGLYAQLEFRVKTVGGDSDRAWFRI